MSRYTFAATLQEPIEQVRPRVEAALKDEGFGVLTEIDVAATLKSKLGLDLAPYLILGACNPRLADRALGDRPVDRRAPAVQRRPSRSPMAPGRSSRSSIRRPPSGSSRTPGIAPIAAEAAERLRRVLDGGHVERLPARARIEHSSAPTHPPLS